MPIYDFQPSACFSLSSRFLVQSSIACFAFFGLACRRFYSHSYLPVKPRSNKLLSFIPLPSLLSVLPFRFIAQRIPFSIPDACRYTRYIYFPTRSRTYGDRKTQYGSCVLKNLARSETCCHHQRLDKSVRENTLNPVLCRNQNHENKICNVLTPENISIPGVTYTCTTQ